HPGVIRHVSPVQAFAACPVRLPIRAVRHHHHSGPHTHRLGVQDIHQQECLWGVQRLPNARRFLANLRVVRVGWCVEVRQNRALVFATSSWYVFMATGWSSAPSIRTAAYLPDLVNWLTQSLAPCVKVEEAANTGSSSG